MIFVDALDLGKRWNVKRPELTIPRHPIMLRGSTIFSDPTNKNVVLPVSIAGLFVST